MAFTELLVNTCHAWRRPGTKDYLGQPNEATESGTPNFTGPCRVSTQTGGRANSDRAVDAFVNSRIVFLAPGADVREDDIVEVLSADGKVVMLAGLVQSRYDVFAGTGTVHHVEMLVTEQTGPLDAPGLASDANAGAL